MIATQCPRVGANGTVELAVKEFSYTEYPQALHYGERSIGAYLRPNGDYAIRLYLPAGELLMHEKCYAYVGPSVEAARAAWRRTVSEWKALLEVKA